MEQLRNELRVYSDEVHCMERARDAALQQVQQLTQDMQHVEMV
jgi:hypothetical protein